MVRSQTTQNSLSRIEPNLRLPRLGLFPSILDELTDQFGELIHQDGSGLTVSEDKKNIYVEASLPGLKLNDIEVTLEKGVLWIKGEKKEEEEDKEKRYYRKASNTYSYRLTLPNQTDETKEPKAVYQDGVMKITFTKAQHSQSKKITVKNS